LWERDVLWFSPESRDGRRQLKQGELKQSVRRDSYVWQVVCPPRYHTLEASPLRAQDSATICLPRGSPGQIHGVYGAPRTQKAQTGERRAPPTPALMVESALAPPSGLQYCSVILRGPGLPGTSAKRWPASDTLMLHPDSPSLDSTSSASYASCTHAPHLVASGASAVPCLYSVPSGHMQRSNPAFHAS